MCAMPAWARAYTWIEAHGRLERLQRPVGRPVLNHERPASDVLEVSLRVRGVPVRHTRAEVLRHGDLESTRDPVDDELLHL